LLQNGILYFVITLSQSSEIVLQSLHRRKIDLSEGASPHYIFVMLSYTILILVITDISFYKKPQQSLKQDFCRLVLLRSSG